MTSAVFDDIMTSKLVLMESMHVPSFKVIASVNRILHGGGYPISSPRPHPGPKGEKNRPVLVGLSKKPKSFSSYFGLHLS